MKCILFISTCLTAFLYSNFYYDTTEDSTFKKTILKRRYSKPEPKKSKIPKYKRRGSLDKGYMSDNHEQFNINDNGEYVCNKEKKSYLPQLISKNRYKKEKYENLEISNSQENCNFDLSNDQDERKISDFSSNQKIRKSYDFFNNQEENEAKNFDFSNDLYIIKKNLNNKFLNYEYQANDEFSNSNFTSINNTGSKNCLYFSSEDQDQNLIDLQNLNKSDEVINEKNKPYSSLDVENLINDLNNYKICTSSGSDSNIISNSNDTTYNLDKVKNIEDEQNNNYSHSNFVPDQNSDKYKQNKDVFIKKNNIFLKTTQSNYSQNKHNQAVNNEFTKIKRLNRQGSFYDETLLNTVDDDDLQSFNRSSRFRRSDSNYIPTCRNLEYRKKY